MKVIIAEGKPKEIAALVLEIQGRQAQKVKECSEVDLPSAVDVD